MSSYASRMRILRETLGLTQADFANAIDTVQGNICHIESGRRDPSRAVIQALYERFNVSANWLLFCHGPMFIEDPFETDPKPSSRTTVVHRKPFSPEEVVVEPTEEEREAAARMLAAKIKMQFDSALENTPRAPSGAFLLLIGAFCGGWLLIFKMIGVL